MSENQLTSKFEKVNDPFVFLWLIIIGAIIYVLDALDVSAGKIFYGFLTLSIITIVLYNLLVKTDYIELPFRENMKLSMIFFSLGWALVALLNFATLKTYSVVKPFILGSATEGASKLTTFATANLELSPFIRVVTTVFSAGTIEPWVFRVVGFLVGAAIVYIFIKLFNSNLNRDTARILTMIGGFIVSAITFMFAHKWNETYNSNPELFIFSLVFSAIILFAIYWLNYGLSFAMGFHMANNFFALGATNSFNGLFVGFFAGGLQTVAASAILILLIVPFVVFIVNIPKLPSLLINTKRGL